MTAFSARTAVDALPRPGGEKLLWSRVQNLESGLRNIRSIAEQNGRNSAAMRGIAKDCAFLLGDEPLNNEDEDLGPMKPWKTKP